VGDRACVLVVIVVRHGSDVCLRRRFGRRVTPMFLSARRRVGEPGRRSDAVPAVVFEWFMVGAGGLP
jgi:hypothetical protein